MLLLLLLLLLLASKGLIKSSFYEKYKEKYLLNLEAPLKPLISPFEANNNNNSNNNNNKKEKNIKKEKSDFDAKGELLKLGVEDQIANDFLLVRKNKRSPLTKTALSGITIHLWHQNQTFLFLYFFLFYCYCYCYCYCYWLQRGL